MKSNIMMVQSQMLSSSFSFNNNSNLEASSGGRRPSSSALSFHHQPCFTSSFKLRISTHTTYSRKSGGLQISCDYSCFQIKDLSYQPPGTKTDLLRGVNLSLRENSLGLIFGQSGSGKTTLLQLIAGLCKPMSGSICVQKYGDDGCPCGTSELLFSERVGIVFQFPERYFVAENVLDEVTFGWPRQKSSQRLKELLALRLQKAFTSVGLNSIALDRNPHSLSGGYKRRLALAIQLVQAPVLLLLDEPLAGLDWKARADVVKLLMHLKKELTLLVVSHDLKELSPIVDESWRMEMGGTLVSEPLMMV